MRRHWGGVFGSRLLGGLTAALLLAACGSTRPVAAPSSGLGSGPSPTASPAGSPTPSPSLPPSTATSPAPAAPAQSTSHPPSISTPPAGGTTTGGGSGGGGSTNGCTLSVIESVAGESSAEDDAKSPGWGPIRANGWTAFVPGGNWIITASDAGADIMSPDGKSDSSLEEWDAQTPWTVEGLQNMLLAPVSNVTMLCSAGAETAGNTHAMEFTGTFRGEAIHGVILVSLLAQTNATLYQAQTRSMYSPAAEWSAAEATTLMVISKRAIQSPNSLPIPQG